MNVIHQHQKSASVAESDLVRHSTQGGLWLSGVRNGHLTLAKDALSHHIHFVLADDSIILDDTSAQELPRLDKYALFAMAEALFNAHPARSFVRLPEKSDPDWAKDMHRAGLLRPFDGGFAIFSSDIYQLGLGWLSEREDDAFPLQYMSTNGRRHPVRRPSNSGPLYARFIPWINKTIRFERANPDLHLDYFHKWMNDPRVDAFWDEAGSLEKHTAFIESRLQDPRTEPLIGYFDDAPFGYFELYWAQEDRLGEHYHAQDFDRGWHVAIGEENFRGKGYLTAWLPSLMHYMFLDDPRTMRIVGEPEIGHDQQIKNLMRSGFAGLKQVKFPHKTSLLVMLLREHFFDNRLYVPDFIRDKDAP